MVLGIQLRVIAMDFADKKILFELDGNCRLSYRELADKLNISSNAVRKRIINLIEVGVIVDFVVELTYAAANSNLVICILQTDGSERPEEFIDALGGYPSIIATFRETPQGYIVFGQCSGTEDISSMSVFIRGLRSVTHVATHIISHQPLPVGKKTEFTRIQLKVLKALLDDPRMSISDISIKSGYTARRVRRTLEELYEGQGVHFGVYWNVNKGDNVYFLLESKWNEKEIQFSQLAENLEHHFPDTYWYSFVSATNPIILSVFVIEHPREIETITDKVLAVEGVESAHAHLLYPAKLYRYPLKDKLAEIIKKSGL
ncbi:MAG: winged helix-turn-helix transcriptional regulator [Candidatus Thorarchaeota archaeon]